MQIYNSFPKYLRFAFYKKTYWDFPNTLCDLFQWFVYQVVIPSGLKGSMVVTDLDIKITALKSDESFVFKVEIELDSISVVGLFV